MQGTSAHMILNVDHVMSYFPLFLDKTAKALREVREGRQIQLIFVYCIAQFLYKTIGLNKIHYTNTCV